MPLEGVHNSPDQQSALSAQEQPAGLSRALAQALLRAGAEPFGSAAQGHHLLELGALTSLLQTNEALCFHKAVFLLAVTQK